MNKLPVYNQDGKVTGEAELNPKIFGLKISPQLIQQAVVTQQANSRQVLAHTKDRSEVRGGGKKPWRQKGTGRARHGSIRSPLWSGGGVTFGPRKNRNFKISMNKKAKKKALFMALSDRAKDSKITLLDDLKMAEIKTKALAAIIKKLPLNGKKSMLIIPDSDRNVLKSSNNLPKFYVRRADNLNIIDVMNAECLLIMIKSLNKMEETYLKGNGAEKL